MLCWEVPHVVDIIVFLACSTGWEKLLDQWRPGTAFIPSPEEPSRAAPSKGRCFRAFFHCVALSLGTSTSEGFMVTFITQCAAWLNGQTSASSLLIRQTSLTSFVNSARSSLPYGFSAPDLGGRWLEKATWGCTALQDPFFHCFQCSEMQDQGSVLQLTEGLHQKTASFRLFHRDSHKSSEGIVQRGQIPVGFCPRARKPTQLSLRDTHGGCCYSVAGLTWESQQLGFRDVKGKESRGSEQGQCGGGPHLPLPQDSLRASVEQLVMYCRDLFGRETQGAQHSKHFPQTAQLLDTLVPRSAFRMPAPDLLLFPGFCPENLAVRQVLRDGSKASVVSF